MTDAPLLCFGEALWDSLPEGLFPGGAPLNVAMHLNSLGAPALPVTAVGDDQLGEELLQRLRSRGIDTRFVNVAPDLPTGTVQVALGNDGVPDYRIVEGVAWDRIPVSTELLNCAGKAPAVIFGTLAQRTPENRSSLGALLEAAPDALKALDVNLRSPYDSIGIAHRSARQADLTKMNREELHRLTGTGREHSDESAARAFASATGCRHVCITAGPDGAGMLYNGTWMFAPGREVNVVDTVGAGDAFLAALLHALLAGETPFAALERACRYGEQAATHRGAAPKQPA